MTTSRRSNLVEEILGNLWEIPVPNITNGSAVGHASPSSIGVEKKLREQLELKHSSLKQKLGKALSKGYKKRRLKGNQ